jgi:nicotinamide mononucleotide adenylyltransferase
MLEQVIKAGKIEQRIEKIVPSPDHPRDEIWLEKLLEKTGHFDVEIGNNDWTNDILENAGFKVIRIPYYRRDIYEGTKIREMYKQKRRWEDRVPEYLAGYIKKSLGKSLNAAGQSV